MIYIYIYYLFLSIFILCILLPGPTCILWPESPGLAPHRSSHGNRRGSGTPGRVAGAPADEGGGRPGVVAGLATGRLRPSGT